MLVASTAPHAGKTAVTAGLAHLLLYRGWRVHLIRLRPETTDDPHASADAALFAALPAVEAPDEPLSLNEAAGHARSAGEDTTVLVEAAHGQATGPVAEALNAKVILVAPAEEGAVRGLPQQAKEIGEQLGAVIVTGAVPRTVGRIRDQLQTAEVPVLAVLPEDRCIAAPAIQAITEALGARVLFHGADPQTSVTTVQIGSIGSDPGVSYFGRVADKAVVTRFDKTDVLLSALGTPTPLIVISRGREPSPYVIDRASNNEGLTILVSPYDTRETVSHIAALFHRTPFSGEKKVERMGELLSQNLCDETLLTRLI